jgi:PAS domain S-box-containing protein
MVSRQSDLTDYALDQVPEAIVITDADLSRPGGPGIIYVNQTMLDITGYSREELIGQSPRIFQGIDTDREVAARIIAHLRAGETTRDTILNYTKDGTPYWTELNISPVFDDEGTVIAYLSIQHDLTRLRKVQEQYERELRLISTGEKIARVGTWGYDLEEDKVLWSDGTYDIWEWDKSEAPPSLTAFFDFFDQADRPMMTAMLDACIKTQTPYQAEVQAHSSKGTPLRLRVLGEAMLGENGRTVAVVGAIRDITQEKRLEAELDETISQSRETEQYFSIARTVAKIGVFDYWIDHDRLHWSDELFEMTGVSRSLFPAKADVFLSRIDARDIPEYQRLMDHAISAQEGYSITIRFNRPDGKAMHMAIIAEVRDSPYGPRIVGIARDVTSDIEASQRLAREQERFRIIADSVSDVLWDFDFEEENFWITPAWPRKLGVDFDGSGTDPVQWLVHVVPEDRERLVSSITHALDSGADRWDCEFTLADPQGTHAEVAIMSTILRNPDGAAHRILGNCRNITVEKRQREGFTRSRALEAVGQMTGGIAHNFNNLLMIIQGNAELLELAQLEEEDAESVRLIMQAAEAAANLTARLLSFSGQSRLQNISVDAGRLVEDVAVLLRSGLTESISLTTQVAPGLWLIEVDGRALEQAVINLAVNARDAIGQPGGRVEIACENVVVTDEMVGGHADLSPGRYVRISVSDNGPGMSEAVKSRAFEPFFTTKDVGKGTGLGLSTVYGFARQSGGSVQIYSELGRGTTVNLYLPACDTAQSEAVAPATVAVGPQNTGQRILVVEDQSEVRAHVERLLSSAGFAVTSAPDGKSALALLQGGATFDLLFTDIIMPGGLNGVQLAEAAKSLSPHIRVLFTSGFPASAFDELGLDQGQNFELLKKPYKRDELITAIARILDIKD